jgi:hypothetical protein
MIEDTIEDVLTVSRGEGSFSLPSHRRHSTEASLTPTTTTPWMENALAMSSMITVPPRMAAARPETGLPFR